MKLPKRRTLIRVVAPMIGVGLVVALTAIPAAASGTITSFTPLCGVPGTPVTITGSGFLASSTGVQFGTGAIQTAAPSSDTSITTTVPAGAVTGSLTVTPGGVASAGTFTFVAAAVLPTINTGSGAVGTTVTLTGTNLCGTTQVHFNALTVAPSNVLSASTLQVVVPVGATTGTLTVTNPAGTSPATTFTVTGTGLPTIGSFSPTCGSAGTSVTINGTNLTGATSLRFFNAVAATILTNTGIAITTTVPSGATTGLISVTTPGGSASSSTSFTIPCASTSHSRSVTFSYHGHNAIGQVNVGDGYAQCLQFVPVYFQQRSPGGWRTLDSIATNKTGHFNGFVPDKSGLFRTQVKKMTLANGAVCSGDVSPTRHSA